MFICSFVYLLVPHTLYAQENSATSLSIHPSIINLFLSPGTTSSTSLSIKNNGDLPLPVRIRFEPLLLENSKPLQSIGSWISISNSSLLITAKKEVTVDIKITLPKTIPFGGYYGVLYVEPFYSSSQSKIGSLVLTKMGVLILGSVGVQDVPLNSIELQKPTLNTFVSETSTLNLLFNVKNNALNHISAKPYLKIHPLFGKTEIIELDERLVFPGTERGWETPFTVKNPTHFYYSADLFVGIGNGLAQRKSFAFVIFPLQQSIVVVLLIAIMISIYRKRKQIKNAFKIILRG